MKWAAFHCHCWIAFYSSSLSFLSLSNSVCVCTHSLSPAVCFSLSGCAYFDFWPLILALRACLSLVVGVYVYTRWLYVCFVYVLYDLLILILFDRTRVFNERTLYGFFSFDFNFYYDRNECDVVLINAALRMSSFAPFKRIKYKTGRLLSVYLKYSQTFIGWLFTPLYSLWF